MGYSKFTDLLKRGFSPKPKEELTAREKDPIINAIMTYSVPAPWHKSILLHLYVCSNGNREVSMTLKTLSEHFGYTGPHISNNALSYWINKGVIEVIKRGAGPYATIYKLHLNVIMQ